MLYCVTVQLFLYGQKLSKQNQMGQGFKRTFFCITSTFLDVSKKESKLSKDYIERGKKKEKSLFWTLRRKSSSTTKKCSQLL